jgi:hypothetical protein
LPRKNASGAPRIILTYASRISANALRVAAAPLIKMGAGVNAARATIAAIAE